MAKVAFTKRKELLCKSLKTSLKKKIIKTIVWSTLLYGAETWSLKKKEMKRLEACEMWFWRKMSKIKWTDKKSNEEILMDIEEERTIIDTIIKRKKKWIGHILQGNSLLKLRLGYHL